MSEAGNRAAAVSMRQVGVELVEHLRASGFEAAGAGERTVLAVAEECGEVTGAYRRWSGQARRQGTFAEVAAELADVVIVSWVTAVELGVELTESARDTVANEVTANRAVLALTVAAGEFVAAYQRSTEVADRLAAVVRSAETVAATLDVDLPAAIEQKLGVMRARGWRDTGTTTTHTDGEDPTVNEPDSTVPTGVLLHICTIDEWKQAQMAGFRQTPSLDSEGFVHLSTPEQVSLPANRLFHGRPDLVLLWLDPDRLAAPVRWEPGMPTDPADMRFPHLYGRIPVDAVIRTTAYRPDANGDFSEPAPPGRSPDPIA